MVNRGVFMLAGVLSLGVLLPAAGRAAGPGCSGGALSEEAMTACLTGVGGGISNTSRGIRPASPTAGPAAAAPAALDLEINFAFGSSELSPEAKTTLDHLANVLNGSALSAKSFKVIGHTDGVGGDQENQALSEARAAAVGAYLAQKGVSAGRLAASGVGKRDFKNAADPGAAENRRVEIVPAA